MQRAVGRKKQRAHWKEESVKSCQLEQSEDSADDSPRGVMPWGTYSACVEINTPQGERKDAKHAKFGKNTLTADLRKLPQTREQQSAWR